MKTLLLLGDSTIDNMAYVPRGRDVVSVLRGMLPSHWGVVSRARDGAVCASIADQLDGAPTANAVIVSVGGNDALRHARILDTPCSSTAEALQIFEAAVMELVNSYSTMVYHLRRAIDTPTCLCTIYNGTPLMGAETAVRMFDDAIYQIANHVHADVVDLRVHCWATNHFVNQIEPSQMGGVEIAAAFSGWIARIE